ncbi:hypothetical protein HPB50_012411 [Hyalomma asiaticum]|uniref:Uncharacterized protein n=1 Tax=Hyalomma asiaticum TaxID=266040 RepID=A0ACB7T034_HYAAI|nr:hypothetical protein HPB50_012411 [Hyalomma asiaticum]
MDHVTKNSADPDQRSSTENPSTKSLKGSTESVPDLVNKQPMPGHDSSKDHSQHKAAAAMSTAKPAKRSSSHSVKLAAGGAQPTEKKDVTAPQKDTTKEASLDASDDDEPAMDPREPLPNRAVIDRRVSMGEVLHTEPPAQFLGESALGAQRDAPEDGMDDVEEPRPDPREPLVGRASIDKSISMGKVVRTTPPPRSPISSGSSSAQHSGWSHEDRRMKQQAMSRVAAFAGLAVFCLALAILSLIVVRSVYFRARESSLICDTDECVKHARDILTTLNMSVNPCDNLYAYVCGNDAHRQNARYADGGPMAHAYIHEVMTTLGDTEVRQRVPELDCRVNRIFLASKRRYASATKAFAAVTSCIESNRHASEDEFVAFMHDRGMTWPLRDTSPRNTTGVLDVVLDLVVNWRVGLWFDIVVSQSSSYNSDPLVVIGEPGDLVTLRLEQLSLFDDVTYDAAARKMSLYLTGGKVFLDDVAVKELRLHEAMLRTIVLPSVEDGVSAGGFDVLLSLGNITQVFGDVLSVADWSSLLDKHLGSAIQNISNTTNILFLNKERLGRLGRLVRSLAPTRVLDVIGWTFSYTYAWMVNAKFDFPAPAGTAGRLETSLLCFAAEQESFGIVRAAPILRDAFNTSEKEKVNAAIQNTTEALVALVLASSTISNYTKREAVAKVGALLWNSWLWPLGDYLHVDSALDTLYANFTADPGSVFESWKLSKKALRAALATPHYERLMTSRYRWPSGSVRYLYTLNELRFTVSALFPPSYVQQGSSAMTFAGIGFKVARQIVRSMDMHGRTLDSTGRKRLWWPPENPKQQQCRFDVAKTAKERSLLTELFAIDVALEAMQESATPKSRKSLMRLKFLEWLSDEQTFYVSYCSHYCGEPHGQLACNLAMNSSQFDEVFWCHWNQRKASSCIFV